MKPLLYISFLLLTACKTQIDIDKIEQREHGLSYIKETNKLVDGEVIRRFDNGKIAERHNYEKGKAVGNWYAYGFDGETVSHGFGVDAKKYEVRLSNIDMTYSFLSINMEGSFAFGAFYIDDEKLFGEPQKLVSLSKEVFNDYSKKYGVNEILFFDNSHEYTVAKSATLNGTFKVDTVSRKEKKTVFIN